MSGDRNSRRAAILTAAATVFRAHGYLRATAEEIAEAAGLAVGSLYNILGNKECVYLAVAEQTGHQLLDKLQHFQLLVRRAPEQALWELANFRITEYPSQRLFFDLFTNEEYFHVSSDDNALTAKTRVAVMYRRYYESVAEIFRNGIDIGAFIAVNPTAAVLLLEGMIASIRYRIDHPDENLLPGGITLREMTELCVAVFRAERKKQRECEHRNEREIFLTRFDLKRLQELIAVARNLDAEIYESKLKLLAQALQQATIVSSENIPPDVVTMNSRVLLEDAQQSYRFVATLTFPGDCGKAAENVSILSPLGAALLGYAENNRIELAGRTLRINKILYQPEASGNYEL